MVYSLIIKLMFLYKLILPNEIETIEINSGYFEIKQKNKNLPSNLTNLIIKSIETKKTNCLSECNLKHSCMIVIYNQNGSCILCKLATFNYLIDSEVGQKTTVYQKRSKINEIMNGLRNYWPIKNDTQDYIDSYDIIKEDLNVFDMIGYDLDRFQNPNGAIYMNPGFYSLPSGFYFGTSFSFLVWIKVLNFTNWGRIIDFGNFYSDNIILSYSFSDSHIPYIQIFRDFDYNDNFDVLLGVDTISDSIWTHLAVVYDGNRQNLTLFVNGNRVSSITSSGPNIIRREKCYIGRSYNSDDPYSSAVFDDLMLFNRALSIDEVKHCMNFSF